MTNWIIAANPKKYDVLGAFQKYDLIDWTQSANFEVGDFIYIYVSKPYQKIMFKVEVVAIGITTKNTIPDAEFWIDGEHFFKKEDRKYARLKKLSFEDEETLTLNHLLNYGLNKAPQGPLRVVEQLQSYLDQYFKNTSYDPNEIEEELIDTIFEGAKQQITINRYERNPIARKKCLEIHGTSCKVCNMNFEYLYGEIGKGFIHVHHLVPLHEINKEYIVNPETDLIPVCPNCHAMLHRKINDTYLSWDELKNLVHPSK